MNLIARAQEKRTWHLAEAAKLEAFIQTALELEGGTTVSPALTSATVPMAFASVGTSVPSRLSPASRPKSGVGAETLNAAEEIVRELGAMTTRELLPFILERGIEVGGKDPIATLSARISSKGDLVTYHGKWQFRSDLEAQGLLRPESEEATDTPTKETSAASLFQTNQEVP